MMVDERVNGLKRPYNQQRQQQYTFFSTSFNVYLVIKQCGWCVFYSSMNKCNLYF